MRKTFILTFICIFLLCFSSCKYQKTELDEYNDLQNKENISIYENFDTLVSDIKEGTHYIYFGKPSCAWCQEYLPIYNEFAINNNQNIKYYNADYVKGTYETKDENGNITLHVNEEYSKVVNWIKQFDENLEKDYIGLNINLTDSEGKRYTFYWLFVPKLFKIVDGQIIDMVSTVDGHNKVNDENGNPYLPKLSNEQLNILYENLNNLFK